MTTATAEAPAKIQFPVIDFAPFLSGDPKAKRQVARAIVDACEGPGFFYLTQHGISQSEFDAMKKSTGT